MNVLINTQFGVDENANFCPSLRLEEKAILTQLYLKDFYTKESRKATIGVATSSSSTTGGSSSTGGGEWISIQEGDTVIRRSATSSTPAQKIESAKMFKGQALDSEEKLNKLIHSYNMYQSAPVQVAGMDAALFPSGKY